MNTVVRCSSDFSKHRTLDHSTICLRSKYYRQRQGNTSKISVPGCKGVLHRKLVHSLTKWTVCLEIIWHRRMIQLSICLFCHECLNPPGCPGSRAWNHEDPARTPPFQWQSLAEFAKTWGCRSWWMKHIALKKTVSLLGLAWPACGGWHPEEVKSRWILIRNDAPCHSTALRERFNYHRLEWLDIAILKNMSSSIGSLVSWASVSFMSSLLLCFARNRNARHSSTPNLIVRS